MSSDWSEAENRPIWINNPRIDSAAMLTAYRKSARPHHPWYGQLKLEQHAFRAFGITVADVDECCWPAPCTEPSCFRCEIQGGFKFRWFHDMWAADYNRLKGRGVRGPDESPEETARLDEEWRQKQPEYQRLERQRMETFLSAMDAAGGSMTKHLMNLAAMNEDVRR